METKRKNIQIKKAKKPAGRKQKTTSKNRNTKSKSPFVSKTLRHCADKVKKQKVPDELRLELYQKVPAEHLSKDNNKGLLLAYQTGSGKTLTACYTAFQLIEQKIVKHAFFLVPASILKQCHFQMEFGIFTSSLEESRAIEVKNGNDDVLSIYWTCNDFVDENNNINDNNDQRNRKMCFLSHTKFYNMFLAENPVLFRKNLNESLVVVDEAHEMVNAFDFREKPAQFKGTTIEKESTTPSTKTTRKSTTTKSTTTSAALAMTWFCHNAKKVLLMTATPFRNKMKDFYPYLAAMHPKNNIFTVPKKRTQKKGEKISDIQTYFDPSKLFYDPYGLSVKFQDLKTTFLKLFKGKLIYVNNEDNGNFAKLVFVNQNYEEFDYFYDVKTKDLVNVEIEMREDEKKVFEDGNFIKNKANIANVYRDFQSEQEIPFDIKESTEMLDVVPMKKSSNLVVELNNEAQAKISIAQFSKLLETMHHYHSKAKNEYESPFPMIIFSSFLDQGTKQVLDLFQSSNLFDFQLFENEKDIERKENLFELEKETKKVVVYSILDGSTKDVDRVNIISNFNAGKIDVMIISNAAATGTNFRGKSGVRQIHIMNEGWNNAAITQTIGRGWRKNSHSMLPKEYQILRIFVYATITIENGKKVKPEIHEYVKRKYIHELKMEGIFREHFTVKNFDKDDDQKEENTAENNDKILAIKQITEVADKDEIEFYYRRQEMIAQERERLGLDTMKTGITFGELKTTATTATTATTTKTTESDTKITQNKNSKRKSRTKKKLKKFVSRLSKMFKL